MQQSKIGVDKYLMVNKILAVCLDCGDTLIDEATEVKVGNDISLRADLIPGADELVRQLKHLGYRLALVADGPVNTFVNNLGPYGLYELFDVHVISETLGFAKPHPQMFQCAVDALGVTPEAYGKVVMLGNNLERDIAGANAFGLVSVWIDWAPRRSKTPAHAGEQPQFTVKTPLELLEVLEHLEQKLAAT
jgi:HAD superfamily hydrolase (TIGR01549 family)